MSEASTDDVTISDESGNATASGTGDVNTDVTSANVDSSKTVEPHMEKALKDLHKYKSRVKELEDAQEKSRIEKLQEQERWQDLASEWREKAEKNESRAQTLEQSMVFDKKYSAVKELALQSGLRREALRDLELIPLDDVEIEATSTGRINVLNAERAVERLKSSRPHWFGRRNNSVNANEPEVVSGGEVKYSDIVKAEENARKTGDYAPYQALINRYRQQTRK